MDRQCDNGQFDEFGNDGCDGCATNAERRRAEATKDQNVVQKQVGRDGSNAGSHWQLGVLRFTQGAAVTLGKGLRNQSEYDDREILFGER